MPTYREIIGDIKKRKFAPVYILMGEEPYYIDRIVEALEASVVAEEDREFDQTVLYGADSNAGMVMEAAGRFPMMAEKRLVILKEGQAMHQAKNSIDKLHPYVLKPNLTTVLGIVFKGDKLNATSQLMKAAKKNKDVVVFESPKIKENKLPEIIKDYCFAKKISIEDRAVDLLASNVGASLSSLFSEIEKLRVALRGEDKRITADLVFDHVGVSKEFNNFELVNALFRRDYFQAINIVKHFEDNPKANPVAVTSATIFNNFQRLLLASFERDKSDKALTDLLKLNYYALRDLKIGLANYNASQLVNVIHAIRDFDTRSKGVGSFQKEFPLLLELVCRIVTL